MINAKKYSRKSQLVDLLFDKHKRDLKRPDVLAKNKHIGKKIERQYLKNEVLEIVNDF